MAQPDHLGNEARGGGAPPGGQLVTGLGLTGLGVLAWALLTSVEMWLSCPLCR